MLTGTSHLCLWDDTENWGHLQVRRRKVEEKPPHPALTGLHSDFYGGVREQMDKGNTYSTGFRGRNSILRPAGHVDLEQDRAIVLAPLHSRSN